MEERYWIKEKREIVMDASLFNGSVLDIGGGGEGIISQLHTNGTVIAIDIRASELEETPDCGIKCVMDATKLAFLDNQFDHVTFFFSLMYMSKEDAMKAIEEAIRVVRPTGVVDIWDLAIPEEVVEEGKDIFLQPLSITVNDSIISTTFGCSISPDHIDFDQLPATVEVLENVDDYRRLRIRK